jgi:release factor glutamine methyltransferase
MMIKDLLKNSAKGIDEKEAVLLLARAINKTEAHVLAHGDLNVPDKAEKRFKKMTAERMKNKPIAYILGSQPFCGLEFKVNKNVLIPRPETEELVEMAANQILGHSSRSIPCTFPIKPKVTTPESKSGRGNQTGRKKSLSREVIIVDIGTGSGCIACSLKKMFSNAIVMASDSSPATLSVVKHNDKKLSTGIKVIHSNLFSGQLLNAVSTEIKKLKRVDLHVIANLPYLPYSDKNDMQKDVVDYEPNHALFADDYGMALIKKCMQQLQKFTLPHSTNKLQWTLYFEIDPRQKNILRAYAKYLFIKSRVQIKKDLSGKDRFLIITNHG